MNKGLNYLKIGDKAPPINGINQEGVTIKMKDFEGRKLILFFYPKDMTPGCTMEVKNLRDNYQVLLDKGYSLLGVSADSQSRHQRFIDKHSLPFDLIADEEKKLIKDYGVWGLKKFMGKEYDGIHRTTFVINEDGVIEQIISKVKTKNHAQQILEAV